MTLAKSSRTFEGGFNPERKSILDLTYSCRVGTAHPCQQLVGRGPRRQSAIDVRNVPVLPDLDFCGRRPEGLPRQGWKAGMKVKEESLIGTLAVLGIAAALAYLEPGPIRLDGRERGPTKRHLSWTLYLPDADVTPSPRPEFPRRAGKTSFGEPTNR